MSTLCRNFDRVHLDRCIATPSNFVLHLLKFLGLLLRKFLPGEVKQGEFAYSFQDCVDKLHIEIRVKQKHARAHLLFCRGLYLHHFFLFVLQVLNDLVDLITCMLSFVFKNESQVAISLVPVERCIRRHLIDPRPVITNVAVYLDSSSIGLLHRKNTLALF